MKTKTPQPDTFLNSRSVPSMYSVDSNQKFIATINKNGAIRVSNDFTKLSHEMKTFILIQVDFLNLNRITQQEADFIALKKCLLLFPDKKIDYYISQLHNILPFNHEAIERINKLLNNLKLNNL